MVPHEADVTFALPEAIVLCVFCFWPWWPWCLCCGVAASAVPEPIVASAAQDATAAPADASVRRRRRERCT